MARGRNGRNWRPDELEQIRVMYMGGASASEVARAFSGKFDGRKITRNAVIGMAHRNAWAGRVKPAKPRKAEKVRAVTSQRTGMVMVKAAPARQPHERVPQKLTVRADEPDRTWRNGRKLGPVLVDPIAAAAPMSTALVPLLEIGAGQCRWVASEHDGALFYCGQPVVQNGRDQASSWCACHYRRMFTKETADQAMRRAKKTADRIVARVGQRFGRAAV